jgi:hypothetical protein
VRRKTKIQIMEFLLSAWWIVDRLRTLQVLRAHAAGYSRPLGGICSFKIPFLFLVRVHQHPPRYVPRILLLVCTLAPVVLLAQHAAAKPPKLQYYSPDSSAWVRATFLNQTWVRYTELNPRSSLDGTARDSYFDISLRRTRFQLYGGWGRVFFYTQYGLNNFNWHSARRQGFFIHDAVGELALHPRSLSLGAGLTGWSGLARYAAPSAANILGYDAPLYEQATNDLTDQFLRKLSIYAKGKLGKLDYRLALSSPLSVKQVDSSVYRLRQGVASFSSRPPTPQLNSYLQYQLWDEESNQTPYIAGTYLGQKRVLTLGAGITYQQDAMWRLQKPAEAPPTAHPDTLTDDMLLLSIDAFMELPVGHQGCALSVYTALQHMDFGQNYVRMQGVNNPATVGGNSLPLNGTGTLHYLQAGYLLPAGLLGQWGTLQVVASQQLNMLEALDSPAYIWEGSLNWLVASQGSKISLGYQSRPVYRQLADGKMELDTRRGTYVVQWQVSI